MMQEDKLTLQRTSYTHDRRLYSLAVSDVRHVAELLDLPSRYFILFLAWDTTGVPDAVVREVADRLLRRGLVYLCTWGPDCARVHDLFDDVKIELEWDVAEDSHIMTVWSERDSLENALWNAVYTTLPDEAYIDDCGAVVAVSVGNPNWAAEIHEYLADLEKLKRAVGL